MMVYSRNETQLKARAKLNFTLDVVGRREDGYHKLETVMQSLVFCDRLYMKKIFKPNYLKVVSDVSWLQNDESNLVYRVAKFMKERYNIEEGIFINLQKRIPTSAGLGGGSADAAAALVGIRNLFSLPLSLEEMLELGLEFGADIPFCIQRRTSFVEGIGEILTPLPRVPHMYILIAKPPVLCSTKTIFKAFDPKNVAKRPDNEAFIYHLKKSDLHGMCKYMANSLESVTGCFYPVIHEIKTAMMEAGAITSLMTGSGPSVFGIFERLPDAVFAKKRVASKFSDIEEIYVTRPFS